jgi:hypothetical protein
MMSMPNPLSNRPARTVPAPAWPLGSTARAGVLGLLLALGGGAMSGCSGGGGAPAPDAIPQGSIAQHPDSNPQAPTYFFAEDPTSGPASSLQILETYWGRLVQVFDLNGTTPVFTNFVIDDQIIGDGLNYVLERDPLTDVERLRILYDQDTTQFYTAVLGLESNLQVVLKKSIAPTELPPFTAVARNAALMVKFNDLLDPSTISPDTLRILTGYAPSQPFEARIFPDTSHGNLSNGSFYSTRVIIDFTVSELEATGTSLPLNALGLPTALSSTQPNVLVSIPTQESPANQQFTVLRALGGRAVSFTNNGPSDPFSPTLDVLRAFRSGGAAELTGDPNNGFLVDNADPVVIGQQSMDLLNTVNFTLGLDQPASIRFHTPSCAYAPQVGDVLDVNSVRMRVVQAPAGSPFNGVVGPFLVRPLCDTCDPPVIIVNTTNPPAGTIRSPYRPQAGGNPDPNYPACFFKFLPNATTAPATGVPIDATISVTFSEPIDPATMRPFDTMVISYGNNAPSANPIYSSVVGNVVPSADRRTFTFQPSLPLRRVLPGGAPDSYSLQLGGGTEPIRDLAGNTLDVTLPPAPFTISTLGPVFDSGGLRLRFDSTDEDLDGRPEVRGQFLYDIQREAIRPRAVQRFSAVVDRTVPSVGAMVDLPQFNLQTPLSNNGSRLMRVWRYHDVAGFGLRDDATHNLDVEGMWWQPFGGTLQVDNFTEFSIGVTHSKYLPDENLDTGLLPQFTASGLVQIFDNNMVDKVGDPMTILAPRARGYQVNPTDLATSTSGDVIAPFPINRGIPQNEFIYWTWRDTGKLQVGAPGGAGADTARIAGIILAAANKGFYPVNKVPTIGLPLLTEFRTYPDALSTGQNGFRVAIAINSSARPYFRVFSTGGVHPVTGKVTTVQPDSAASAAGGINPNNGQATWWGDNTFYYGQADFLVRVSRMHTAWFDSLGTATIFAEPVLEPGPEAWPTGTQLIVGVRGATAFVPGTNEPHPYTSAANIDSYGNLYTNAQLTALGITGVTPVTPTFIGSTDVWRNTMSAINGARYFQARVTFLCNPLSGLSPDLTTLAFAYRR